MSSNPTIDNPRNRSPGRMRHGWRRLQQSDTPVRRGGSERHQFVMARRLPRNRTPVAKENVIGSTPASARSWYRGCARRVRKRRARAIQAIRRWPGRSSVAWRPRCPRSCPRSPGPLGRPNLAVHRTTSCGLKQLVSGVGSACPGCKSRRRLLYLSRASTYARSRSTRYSE